MTWCGVFIVLPPSLRVLLQRRQLLSEAVLEEEYRFCCPESNSVLHGLLGVAGEVLLPYPIVPCLTLPSPTMPHPTLPYSTLLYSTLLSIQLIFEPAVLLAQHVLVCYLQWRIVLADRLSMRAFTAVGDMN